MKRMTISLAAALCLGSIPATAAIADNNPPVDLGGGERGVATIRAGASHRGGMKLKVSGAGSHSAGTAYSSSRTVGTTREGLKDSESSNLSFGYTGGERKFGEGTTALGSGTIHADGTYEGGDYSATYDDVFFSDNRTTTQTLAGQTTTRTSATATGGLSWSDDDDPNGWGFRLDADVPLLDGAGHFGLAVFTGLRGWWGIEGESSGTGAGVSYRTSTTTTPGAVKTTESFYDVTAPLTLDGKLDFDNAEVFQGSTVKYTKTDGTASSSGSSAFSQAKVEADADLYQVALGVSLDATCGRWTLSLRPALLLNYVDAEATRTEVLATPAGKLARTWSDSADEDKFALGGGVEALLECALDGNWGLWISGGYEWIDSVEFDIGPQKAEIDPSAWTASAGISRQF